MGAAADLGYPRLESDCLELRELGVECLAGAKFPSPTAHWLCIRLSYGCAEIQIEIIREFSS